MTATNEFDFVDETMRQQEDQEHAPRRRGGRRPEGEHCRESSGWEGMKGDESWECPRESRDRERRREDRGWERRSECEDCDSRRGPHHMPPEGSELHHGGPRRMPMEGCEPHHGGPRRMPFPPERAHRPELPDPDSLTGLFLRSHRALELGRGPADHRGSGRVLRLLELGGGSLSQRELMELMGVQPGSLSELLGKMERRGQITREQQEDDRRKVTVSLTDAGREQLAHRGEKPDPFAVLTADEQEELRCLLAKLVDAWEGKPEA